MIPKPMFAQRAVGVQLSRFISICESRPVAASVTSLFYMDTRGILPGRPEPMVVVEEDEQPFLQDARNLDLISMILQGLLDSTEDTGFTLVTSANTMVPPPQFGPVEAERLVRYSFIWFPKNENGESANG